MTKTTAPAKTPSPDNPDKAHKVEGNKNAALTMFIGAVLDISWQLAIVVLVPIIGGYELDKHLNDTPVFTIIGFVLAMAGTFVVIRKVFVEYNDRIVDSPKEKQ